MTDAERKAAEEQIMATASHYFQCDHKECQRCILVDLLRRILDAADECKPSAKADGVCQACNGAGCSSLLLRKDNPLHVPDCPACNGTGRTEGGRK